MKTAIASLVLVSVSIAHARADDFATLKSAFKDHCTGCHGGDGHVEGKVDLHALNTNEDFKARPRLLEKIKSALRDRLMPPPTESEIPDKTRARMIEQVSRIHQLAVKSHPFEPTPIRRMNRFQYNNAVMDLLGLDRQIFRLNERIIRRRSDYFRPETGKMPAEVRVSIRPLSKDIDGQRPEGFRGVAAFPQDKRAEFGFDNRADHLTLSPLLMESFLQLSQSIAQSPDLNPQECRTWDRLFAEPGKKVRASGRFEGENNAQVRIVKSTRARPAPQEMSAFGPKWSGKSQLFWRGQRGDGQLTLSVQVVEAGSGLELGLTTAPDYGRFEVFLDGKRIGEPIDLYSPRVDHLVRRLENTTVSNGNHTLVFKCIGKNTKSTRHFFGLDYVEVTGQKPTKSEGAPPSKEKAIEDRLKWLLRRAFKRPADEATLQRFNAFARQSLADGATFERTMRTVVGAVVGMPEFLYYYETAAAAKSQSSGRSRIDDFELASRLSNFFWSSIPDDELLDLAEAGKLRDTKVLAKQIDRMMNDRRSSRFCDNFPSQWLQLDRLITSVPDRKKYPYFYYHGYRTSMHMMSEPLLLFETVFVENRSVMELLDPDFTWESDMLRANYEGKGAAAKQVNVQVVKRVPLKDPRRGGVITNAAVMTMTSTPTRTQPITRGAWVNAVIFNDPPEPPPADVPPLPENDKAELEKMTIRERLAAHRKRADCAGCHEKIDPLGFALENYGPTGVWRKAYENGRKVDPSGKLFNQHEFKSLVDFKKLIVKDKQRFLRGFTAHVLSYALGRELGPADSPTLDHITSQAMAGNDGLREIMRAVAMSESFLHKNSRNSRVAKKALK